MRTEGDPVPTTTESFSNVRFDLEILLSYPDNGSPRILGIIAGIFEGIGTDVQETLMPALTQAVPPTRAATVDPAELALSNRVTIDFGGSEYELCVDCRSLYQGEARSVSGILTDFIKVWATKLMTELTEDAQVRHHQRAAEQASSRASEG